MMIDVAPHQPARTMTWIQSSPVLALSDSHDALAALTDIDRRALVRQCARLAGSAEAAEDLAQQTLFEAWRHANRLREPEGRDAWLYGIARNVCARWRRTQARQRVMEHGRGDQGEAFDALPAGDDDFSIIEQDLDRSDLAWLLDRALGLLQPESRAALIAHYIEGLPQRDIAEHLQVSEGAVAVRLHRGRVILRETLDGLIARRDGDWSIVPFPAWIAPDAPPADAWQSTRIWCPSCGDERMMGIFRPDGTWFRLRCARCHPHGFASFINSRFSRDLLVGVRGFKPALNRLIVSADAYYRHALVTGWGDCQSCGKRVPLRYGRPPSIPAGVGGDHGVFLQCPHCGEWFDLSLDGMSLMSPAGRQFWKAHPRITLLPLERVEAEGRPALVIRLRARDGAAEFATVHDAETLRIIKALSDQR